MKAAPQGQLLETEQRWSRSEPGDGDGMLPPGWTDVPQPNLCDIPVRNGMNLDTRGTQPITDSPTGHIARVTEESVDSAARWHCGLLRRSSRPRAGDRRQGASRRGLEEYPPIDHEAPS